MKTIILTFAAPCSIFLPFYALQAELSAEIDENMRSTRQKLLENFDTEVAEKLSVYKEEAQASLNRFEALLWDLTCHALDGRAAFDERSLTFRLNRVPHASIPSGLYTLKRQDEIGHHYRLQHPLAQWVMRGSIEKMLPEAELIFNYSEGGRKVSVLEPMIGRSGTLTAQRLTVNALESEDYIITAAVTDGGHELDPDQARRLFNLPARIKSRDGIPKDGVWVAYERLKKGVLGEISERNTAFFEEEMEKLDRWAEDKRKSLKSTLKDYDEQINDLKKQARMAPNLPEKLAIQKKIRNLDKKRDEAWREYDEGARDIERQKDSLIDRIEARLQQEIEEEDLFTVRWKLV